MGEHLIIKVRIHSKRRKRRVWLLMEKFKLLEGTCWNDFQGKIYYSLMNPLGRCFIPSKSTCSQLQKMVLIRSVTKTFLYDDIVSNRFMRRKSLVWIRRDHERNSWVASSLLRIVGKDGEDYCWCYCHFGYMGGWVGSILVPSRPRALRSKSSTGGIATGAVSLMQINSVGDVLVAGDWTTWHWCWTRISLIPTRLSFLIRSWIRKELNNANVLSFLIKRMPAKEFVHIKVRAGRFWSCSLKGGSCWKASYLKIWDKIVQERL